MATKKDIRIFIQSLEPDNEIAARENSNHEDLSRELRATRRRKASREAAQAVDVVLKFREEDGEVMSWRFFLAEGGSPMDVLQYGPELPIVGTLLVLDETTCRVSSHTDGLDIVAGDLPVREKFDGRRKYATPNGTVISYKRPEDGRIVLWSYKIQGEIAIGPQVPITRTDMKAKPIASVAKRMTQKILAAYVISQNPHVTGAELTKTLQEAFPGHRINSRHGPHYLSHSRHGKLPEAPDDDPRLWGRGRGEG